VRILIYSDNFGGKTTTFIYNEVVALSKIFDVKYVCSERQNEKLFPFDSVHVVPYRINKFIRKIRWWLEINGKSLIFKNRVFSNGINEIAKEFQPDIIHCHFGYEALRFFDNLSEEFKKTPTVISFRGYDASQFLNRRSYVSKIKALLDKPTVHCTFVCDFLRQNLIRSHIHVDRFLILHSGTKLDFFTPKEIIENDLDFTFLQISSFEPYKGHVYTIKAFKKLLENMTAKKPKLILAGGGALLQSIKELVSKEGLNDSVDFVGWVNHQEAIILLSKANVFVQHSVTENGATEGIPNSLMEAMAMELPVISTYHAGIPELVENGVNGFLVAERDIDQYAKKMLEIMEWPTRIKINREKIQKEFEFSVHMKKLEGYYNSIVNRN
jgi:glycosyltransferase involved in cell wall biosynthesis